MPEGPHGSNRVTVICRPATLMGPSGTVLSQIQDAEVEAGPATISLQDMIAAINIAVPNCVADIAVRVFKGGDGVLRFRMEGAHPLPIIRSLRQRRPSTQFRSGGRRHHAQRSIPRETLHGSSPATRGRCSSRLRVTARQSVVYAAAATLMLVIPRCVCRGFACRCAGPRSRGRRESRLRVCGRAGASSPGSRRGGADASGVKERIGKIGLCTRPGPRLYGRKNRQ